MAKGIEDTTFYRWHRLVALNEVGGDPAAARRRGPADPARAGPPHQQRHWPLGHDHAVHPRHQAQRGRAGPAARRRRRRRGVGAVLARLPRGGRRARTSTGRPRTCCGRRWSGSAASPPSGCTTTSSRRSARPSSARPGSTRTTDYEARVLAPGRPAPWPPATCATLVADAVAHNAEGIRATVLAAEAAAADACRGSPTPTRAARSSTSRWSTPTTAAPSTTPRGVARLAAAATRAPARRDLDDEKLLITSRALRLRREPPRGCSARRRRTTRCRRPPSTRSASCGRLGRRVAARRLAGRPTWPRW